jgi:hypothetical protein
MPVLLVRREGPTTGCVGRRHVLVLVLVLVRVLVLVLAGVVEWHGAVVDRAARVIR